MPTAKAPDTSVLNDRISAIEDQNKQINSTLQNILAALGALTPPKPNPAASHPRPAQEDVQASDDGWTAEQYWIRLKPYNKQAGIRRMRTLLPEIGRPINGGTGQLGSIPEWVRVDRRTAIAVSRYHQNDNNMSSPFLLDIVTDEERQKIDEAEGRQRMASMGLAGMTPAQVFQQSQKIDYVQPRAGGVHPRRTPPSLAHGAEVYQESPPTAADGHSTALAPTGGRGRALEGLAPTFPPAPVVPTAGAPTPRGEQDGEDFARTAAAAAAVDAQIAHVEGLGPVASGNLRPR